MKKNRGKGRKKLYDESALPYYSKVIRPARLFWGHILLLLYVNPISTLTNVGMAEH
jgi:hypothetical protein